MIRTDETALICDLAETYGVMDYRALPLKTLAALSSGLREDSRIRMAMTGQKIPADTALLAAAVDRLSLLWWAKTKNGHDGVNKPESLLLRLLGKGEEQKTDYETYQSPEEFNAAWKRATGEV